MFNFYYMKLPMSKLYSFYLAIVSFVSLVAIAINLWIVLTSVGQYFIITDEEYLQNREYYKIEQCEYWNPRYDIKTPTEDTERTPEEIEECKQNVRESVSASRSFNLKDMFISSWAWFTVFLVIFLFHYPKFLKARKED